MTYNYNKILHFMKNSQIQITLTNKHFKRMIHIGKQLTKIFQIQKTRLNLSNASCKHPSQFPTKT